MAQNYLYWKCPSCGWTAPRHPNTTMLQAERFGPHPKKGSGGAENCNTVVHPKTFELDSDKEL